MFCKRKETRGFAGSPGTQRRGAPKSYNLHPEPQRPSEDSCEGLHHLSLKDDAVPLPPSPQSLEPKSKSGYPPALSPILWMPVSGCRSLCGEAALAGVAEGDGRSLGRAGRVPGARGRQTAYLASRWVLVGSDHRAAAARAPTRLRGARSYDCTVFCGTILPPLHRPRPGTHRAPPHPGAHTLRSPCGRRAGPGAGVHSPRAHPPRRLRDWERGSRIPVAATRIPAFLTRRGFWCVGRGRIATPRGGS